jgi:hypothetical protein
VDLKDLEDRVDRVDLEERLLESLADLGVRLNLENLVDLAVLPGQAVQQYLQGQLCLENLAVLVLKNLAGPGHLVGLDLLAGL